MYSFERNQKYPEDDSIAAPRLRKFLRAVTQGSQSLALGLALIAASQLLCFAWLLQREVPQTERAACNLSAAAHGKSNLQSSVYLFSVLTALFAFPA